MNEILKEHKENFLKIFKLAKVDLIKTYKGAFLGWLWAIIRPSITIFVYWFTIEIGLKSSKFKHGYPNFLWLIASVVPWFYISDMIISGAASIRNYSYLVTKMKFPISIIPTIVNVSKFLIFILLEIIVIALFAINGYSIDLYVVQILFYMLMSFLFFEVLSIFSSIIATISKDFLNLVRSINVIVFWMSGILWDINDISIEWIRKVLWFNPVAYLIDGFRNCFINKVFFFEEPKKLLAFLISLLFFAILSAVCYKKLRKELPDVL